MRYRFRIIFIALALVTAACGGENKIGEDLKPGEGGGSGPGAIGQRTTTTAAVAVTTTAARGAATTAKPTPTTVAQPSAIFKIQDDTKGQYIEPLQHSVRAGSLVRFVNEDDTPHTITGKIGSTVVLGPSPSIAPGGVWDARPGARGTYDIVDEQRPYAAGVTLTVS